MPMTALTQKERTCQTFLTLRNRLAEIYAGMDHAYGEAADRLGFVCSGCETNCCRSRFYHYTYLEYYYLQEGFNHLEPALRISVRRDAAIPSRRMCPLNREGRCCLYPYRPMICRLHGIPHKLQRPGQDLLYGSGCETFERERCDSEDIRFDRTPHYRQMAELELKFKKEAGLKLKLKMTVAEMITSFDTL